MYLEGIVCGAVKVVHDDLALGADGHVAAEGAVGVRRCERRFVQGGGMGEEKRGFKRRRRRWRGRGERKERRGSLTC